MAGKPIQRDMVAKVERLAGDVGMAPDEWVLARIASGETISAIARELGYSRQLLGMWLNRTPDGKAAVTAAREAAAHAMAEQALELTDEATPATAQVRKLQADQRRWLASRWNRGVYGEAPAVQVNNLSVSELHLDSLRRVAAADDSAYLPPISHQVDGQVVENKGLDVVSQTQSDGKAGDD